MKEDQYRHWPGRIVMGGVLEYGDRDPVALVTDTSSGRLCVMAENEAGSCCTLVDLLDLIAWLKANRPDLLA